MILYFNNSLQMPYSENYHRLNNTWKEGKREVVLTGGRGKGKTVALLLYLINRCLSVPGIKIVIARSDYSTIKKTLIPSLENDIFHYPLGNSRNKHPKNPFILAGGVDAPKALRFVNGSEIAFIGLDDKSKVRGMACDIFVLNEGTTEDTSEVWGAMGGTLAGGRAGNWYVNGRRFSQMITDTNPSHKFHWLYKDFDVDNGVPDPLKCFLTWTHHDNPFLTEPGTETLNADGEQTIADLIRYYGDGYEAQRMIWGQWVAAEGAVYGMYTPKVHEVLMSRGDFSVDTKWHIGQDHGGTSPFAIMLTGEHDGTYRTYKELSLSGCEFDVVMSAVGSLLTRERILAISTYWCDTNVPAFNESLRSAGYPVIEADKRDKVGNINTVKQVIRDNRYFVNTTSLEERDLKYEGPQGIKEEILGFAYLTQEKQETAANPEMPVLKNNHWCDALEYHIAGVEARGQVLQWEDYGSIRMGGRQKRKYLI